MCFEYYDDYSRIDELNTYDEYDLKKLLEVIDYDILPLVSNIIEEIEKYYDYVISQNELSNYKSYINIENLILSINENIDVLLNELLEFTEQYKKTSINIKKIFRFSFKKIDEKIIICYLDKDIILDII